MTLPQILKDLQRFVQSDFDDQELLKIKKEVSRYSDEEILIATLKVLPTKSQINRVKIEENHDSIVELTNDAAHGHIIHRASSLSRLSTGDAMYLRSQVIMKLQGLACTLENDHNIKLILKCGYRKPTVQAQAFDDAYQIAKQKLEHLWEDVVYGYANLSVADPDIAAHPTGGAVDVSLFDLTSQRELDFWGWDFPNGSIKNLSLLFMNWRDLSLEQIKNRLFLAKHMVKAGFWLFPGEFWHYSTGDAESAAGLNQDVAVYAQQEF